MPLPTAALAWNIVTIADGDTPTACCDASVGTTVIVSDRSVRLPIGEKLSVASTDWNGNAVEIPASPIGTQCTSRWIPFARKPDRPHI
jgi:hypothetical protein